MILVQIATALAIGIYVVLSKDVRHKCLDATPRETLRLKHSAAQSIRNQISLSASARST